MVSFIVFINSVALLYHSSPQDITNCRCNQVRDKSHAAYNTPVAIADTATNLSLYLSFLWCLCTPWQISSFLGSGPFRLTLSSTLGMAEFHRQQNILMGHSNKNTFVSIEHRNRVAEMRSHCRSGICLDWFGRHVLLLPQWPRWLMEAAVSTRQVETRQLICSLISEQNQWYLPVWGLTLRLCRVVSKSAQGCEAERGFSFHVAISVHLILYCSISPISI